MSNPFEGPNSSGGSNPFLGPNPSEGSNPFLEPNLSESGPSPSDGPNPFTDPSVTVHTESADNDVENYEVAPAGTGVRGTSQGAWNAPVTGYSFDEKSPTAAEWDLRQREADLLEREKMLERRQKEFRELQRSGTAIGPPKNWPSCSPILYHDIEAEIPDHLQSTVRNAYRSYLLFCGTLLYNFLCLTLAFSEKVHILSWIFAGLYAVSGIPGAFTLWYRRLYNAALNDRGVTYLCFFFGNALHIAFCLWAAIAIPVSSGSVGSSFAGFIETLEMFDKATWLGGVYLACFILWVLNVVVSIYVWQAVMREFRGGDGPENLQNEAQAAASQPMLTKSPSRI